jgi:GTPase SAR1 family protein
MAFRDDERGLLVIRIVYDGPAFAGKTTTLRTLAGKLARRVYTPEEIGGRTIFFDWIDYEAGLFEGRRIRCQIVSVPGQASLVARRRSLLETADVVVFVADTSRRRFAESREQFEELLGWLEAAPGPLVGVVFQANKRDVEDAVELSELMAALPGIGRQVGVVESVATDGAGIREAFILGVRLALERVREVIRAGGLTVGRPPVDSGEDLHRSLCALEEEELRSSSPESEVTSLVPSSPAADLLSAVLREAAGAPPADATEGGGGAVVHRGGPPSPPGSNVQFGLVWPAVEGRLALVEASVDRCEVRDWGDGRWGAFLPGGWAIESSAPEYPTQEEGRRALLEWARLHSAARGSLSRRRCITLVENVQGGGGWRLWQVVKRQASLADLAQEALGEVGADDTVTGLVHAARLLFRAADQFARIPVPLSPRLRDVAIEGGLPRYVGFVAPVGQKDQPEAAEAVIRKDLADLLAALTGPRREALLRALAGARLDSDDAGRDAAHALATALRESLPP